MPGIAKGAARPPWPAPAQRRSAKHESRSRAERPPPAPFNPLGKYPRGKRWASLNAQRQPTRAVAATRRVPKATPQCAVRAADGQSTAADNWRNGPRENPCAAQRQAGNPAPPRPRERGRQPPRGRNNSRPEACAARLSRAALAPTKQISWLGKPWAARRAQRQPSRAVAATRLCRRPHPSPARLLRATLAPTKQTSWHGQRGPAAARSGKTLACRLAAGYNSPPAPSGGAILT